MTVEQRIINKLESGYKYSRFCNKIYIHDKSNITKKISLDYKIVIERMVKNGELENVGTWIKLKN